MDWYYLRDGRTMGPVPEGSIRAWLESEDRRAWLASRLATYSASVTGTPRAAPKVA